MKKLLTTLSLMVAFCVIGFSQGQFDVRFNLNTLDCDGEQLLLDIDVRASDTASTFTIAEQNYRFSFNRAAIFANSADIDNEGTLSNFILDNGVLTALYSPHNLEGSLDTIVSYNIELAGGDGVPATLEWINVGTLAFTVADIDECLDLTWHNRSLFPPTFVSTFEDGARLPVNEGAYINDLTFSCFSDICAAALPVELTSFDAVNAEDCTIELTWKTATETNNAYFKIEKSIDGINYETIGTVEGKGNSNTQAVYTFTDRSPSLDNYYRLTQVDISGTATLGSKLIIRSTCFDDDAVNTIEVFPNPVNNRGSVKFYNTNFDDTELELNISDALGRNVHTEILPVNEGANIVHFNTEKLIPGTYFVQLKGNNWLSTSEKIVKID